MTVKQRHSVQFWLHGSAILVILLMVMSGLKGQLEREHVCECNEQLFDQVTANSGYFCGSVINRADSSQSCTTNKLYLCERNNKTAVPIGRCPRSKKSANGCNDSFKSRNNCLRNMKCSCRNGKTTRNSQANSCGQQLEGLDCLPNVIYQCRLIGSPVPLQNCPNGCFNGKCLAPIVEVSLEEVDKPSRERSDAEQTSRRPRRPRPRSRTNTTNVANDTNEATTTGPGIGGEHEVEFVTFSPLIRIHFNP